MLKEPSQRWKITHKDRSEEAFATHSRPTLKENDRNGAEKEGYKT